MSNLGKIQSPSNSLSPPNPIKLRFTHKTLHPALKEEFVDKHEFAQMLFISGSYAEADIFSAIIKI